MNKTRAIRPYFEYAPFRKYHTERVKRMKKEFWVRYDHDKSYQNLVDTAIVFFGTGLVTVAVIVISLLASN